MGRLLDEARDKAIEAQRVCVDDYGNGVYRCHLTAVLVWPHELTIQGAIVPGVTAYNVMANTAQAKALRRVSQIAFHESEANCNTCIHLVREAHQKRPGGILYGRCNSANARMDAHPYRNRIQDDVFPFAPDDWQGMPCYESRYQEAR